MKNIADFLDKADQSELRLLLTAVERKLDAGKPDADLRVLSELEGNSRYLSTEQLAKFSASLSAWKSRADTPAQKRSRSRIWLAYLVLRYGALRLGEALSLDDRTDIRAEDGEIEVRGQWERTVQIPKDVGREIKALLDDPMFYSLRGQVLHIDPGYLRRKFYEQAETSGLPKDLLNARVLRYSRAVELLSGGVPLRAVQNFLGRPARGAVDEFQPLSAQTGQRIVQQYLNREVKMKTSARNLFMGRVSGLVRDGLLAEIRLTTLSGLDVVAVITEESFNNLQLAEGSVVTASVKAPWVVLGKPGLEQDTRTSARNKFSGKVSEVTSSSIAAEILVELYEGSKVCALVTKESVEKLELSPGAEVLVMFKAFSVILNAD